MPTGRIEPAGARSRNDRRPAAGRGNAAGARSWPVRSGRSAEAAALAAALLAGAACVQERVLPGSFVGPSELALSLQLTAAPDVLPLDGAARSVVSVLARDERARPVAQLPLTVQIVASNELQDFGTLSARSVTTGPNGRARFSYTAPLVSTHPAGQADPGTVVAIRVTPSTENHANALGRSVVIRLVPPGSVLPAFRVAAGFTFEPSPATAREATLFSARYCDAARDSPPACVDDPGRLATRFTWSFGDGAQAAGQTVSHVFDAPGVYPVRLAVADAFRRSASRTRSVRVEAGAVPEPAFDVSPSLPIADAPVVFDAARTTSSRPVAAYEWSLGDGATGSGRVLTHRYARAGVYAVTLTVTDDRGGAATAAGEVTVASGDPTAAIDVSPQRPAVGQPVSFSGLRSAARPGRTIVAHAWTLGDAGATAQGGSVTHTYRAAGTYVVTLVVTDDFGASSTASVTVSVGEVPAVAWSPPQAGRVTFGAGWVGRRDWPPRRVSTLACGRCAENWPDWAWMCSSSRIFRTSSTWPTFVPAPGCSSSHRRTPNS